MPWRLALPVLFMAIALGPILTMTSHAAPASGKHPDKREIEARKAFAAGRYQEALELFTDLYADKLHPTYLRNVGRCYQNLKQPENAISSFRDYLRQARELKDSERAEVNGFIAEMEEMLRQQKAEAAAASPPPPAPPPVPLVPPIPPEEDQIERTAELTTPPAAEPESSTPLHKKAWFWTVLGVVVVGAVVGGLWAGGVFSKSGLGCSERGGCI
jgi:hypothetical protein